MANHKDRPTGSISKFNAKDPKYKTFCCGVHVTTFARFLVLLGLVAPLYSYYRKGDPFDLLPFLLNALGAYGVFMEARTPLFIYMAISMSATLLLMVFVPVTLAADPESDGLPEDGITTFIVAVSFCVFFAVLHFFFCFTIFWGLTEYIKDRENSEKESMNKRRK